MRYAMIAVVAALCALLAAPAAAQRSPGYEAPSETEKRQLETRRDAGLEDLRGGEGARRATLDDTERERIKQLTDAQAEGIERLRNLRGGDHVHIHWGVWVGVPCACGTIALVLLLLLLL